MLTQYKTLLETCGRANTSWSFKNNIQGSDKYCEAMHFKEFDLRFHMLQHIFKGVR